MGNNDDIEGASALGGLGKSAAVENGLDAVNPTAAASSAADVSPLLSEVAASLEAGSTSALEALQALVRAHVSDLEAVNPLPPGFVDELMSIVADDPALTDLLQSGATEITS